MIRYLSKTNPKLLRGVALLRLDFNTKDDWRMRAVIPTIRLLIKTSSKIVIVSHYGRPKPHGSHGHSISSADKKFSLKKDAATLAKLLHRNVIFIENFDFASIKSQIKHSPSGSIFLLENLRFNAGEEKNDPKFAKKLASLADFYVNDAFAVSHRANASLAAITKFIPSYAGLELENEIYSLSRVMIKPKHPLVLILGGAKAADKLGVIAFFKKRADWVLLGGGPANTILSLTGMDIKDSVRDTDKDDVRKLSNNVNLSKIVLPEDFIWHSRKILDLGPKTLKLFDAKVRTARTIIWSGPIGLIEEKKYARGSIALAKAIGENRKAFSIAGGGETVMFLKKYRLDKKFTFVSTGGGAMIDYLAGETLPGIEALQ